MNRTALKTAACLSMLADHAGFLLFPGLVWLRWIGRLAFPLFAWFIGEGVRYTRDRRKYFLQIFLLGVGCQLVYFVEELVSGVPLSLSSDCWDMNILLTFSLAVILCCAFKDAKRDPDRKNLLKLAGAAAVVFGVLTACWAARTRLGASFNFDYGVNGVLLPLSTLVFEDRERKIFSFGCATLLYCILFMQGMPYVWFSLIALVFVMLYNGRPGTAKFKYGFYIFYPAHLAGLYIIKMLFF